MEKAERDIQFINQIYFRMLDFSNNCLDVHFSSGSNKKSASNCNLLYNWIKNFVFWENCRWKRIFFHCFLYANLPVFLKFCELAKKGYKPKE